ncbi:MAG: PfkB family carbohydrate kinase, partial [Actinomycetota bacterium]
ELGHRAHDELERLGVRVCSTFKDEPQRRAITHIDASGERTITVVGSRLGPDARDPLPWDELEATDAVYLTQGNLGAVKRARYARVLVATSRIVPLLHAASIPLDALVGSATDPAERYLDELSPAPRLVVRTDGARGGTYEVEGTRHSFEPSPPPGPVLDRYGAGDTFAAILTYGLGLGEEPDAAIRRAADTSAATIVRFGPY